MIDLLFNLATSSRAGGDFILLLHVADLVDRVGGRAPAAVIRFPRIE